VAEENNRRKNRKLFVFSALALMVGLLGLVLPELESYPIQYINATNITTTGATAIGNLSNITEINQGFYNVSESTTPFYVTVNFTNITNFSFLEAKAIYFSTTGTPSTHVVDLEIYCTIDNEYEDLFFLENAAEWRYFTRHFPDSMHFIDSQGNVSIKFNHTANGNVNHRLYIDTVRLIIKETFEQNTVTLNQYFNTTTTTGGSGASNLSQLAIDTNKSWLGYNIYNVTIDNQSMSSKVNKSGDTMLNDSTLTFLNHTRINFTNSIPWELANEHNTDTNQHYNFGNMTGRRRAQGIENWFLYSTGVSSVFNTGDLMGSILYSTPQNGIGIGFRNRTGSNTTLVYLEYFGSVCIKTGTTTSSPVGCDIRVYQNGTVNFPNLAGVGNRPLCANSTGNIIICP